MKAVWACMCNSRRANDPSFCKNISQFIWGDKLDDEEVNEGDHGDDDDQVKESKANNIADKVCKR